MARKLILIFFALIVAGSTVWFVKNWAGGQKNTVVQQVAEAVVEPQKPTVKILVAAGNLSSGTLVREEHLDWQEWPEVDGLDDKYVVESKSKISDFIGTVVRHGIASGEPISEGRLVKPGQSGFLAAVLQPGQRAISINVNATSGVAGFVFPGDRVDLILTFNVSGDGEEATRPRHASETILTDVRVVAMDQSTDDQSQEAAVRGIATLEVNPKEVEIVSVARELGKLSLSLRSIARHEDEEKSGNGKTLMKAERGRGYTWDSEASSLISAPHKTGKAAQSVVVVRAADIKQKSFD